MRKSTTWMIVLLFVLALVGVGLLFWRANFRLALSEMNVESNLSTYAFGKENRPASMAPGQDLAVVVDGPAALAGVIEETCRVAFSPRFATVQILDEIPEDAEGAILVLEFSDAGLLWTPVYGRAQAFTVKVAYASQGDMGWRHQSPVTLSSEDAPMIRSDGEVTVSGRSWGLMSRPGFYQTVANPLATRLLAHLADLYEVPGS